ncbi:MAG: PadR family transcriptional regulator [Proteobacteria bacterium]|nr:PadR family transcriptional regulator [Pseudomonadota bacterium]
MKGAGEGAIYGILASMEETGMLEGRWRESSSRMLKIYHVTDKGAKLLEQGKSTSAELGNLATRVLKQMPA